jgi:hypothetical protein
LAFDGAGNLFASSLTYGSIYKFTPQGTQYTFASNLGGLTIGFFAFDPSGNLFVSVPGTSVSHIYEFTPDGRQSVFSAAVFFPTGLAVDANGDVFVGDQGSQCIYKFTPSGVRSTFASGLDQPQALAFDGSGNLFEADYGSGNVYEFTPGGTRSTFASGIHPNGLAFTSTPEPPAFALLTAGAVALLGHAWRRKQRRQSVAVPNDLSGPATSAFPPTLSRSAGLRRRAA